MSQIFQKIKAKGPLVINFFHLSGIFVLVNLTIYADVLTLGTTVYHYRIPSLKQVSKRTEFSPLSFCFEHLRFLSIHSIFAVNFSYFTINFQFEVIFFFPILVVFILSI